MASDKHVMSATIGFEWVIYAGCETNDDGEIIKETCERITGGWEPSRSRAERAATETLGEVA